MSCVGVRKDFREYRKDRKVPAVRADIRGFTDWCSAMNAADTVRCARPESKSQSQSGFGLVESMVALVVISVGMLGIAVLKTQGLGAGRTARFRIQAVNLAADMADRIRANRLGRSGYAAAGTPDDCDPEEGGDAHCVPGAVAARDLAEWTQNVAAALPDGEGAVRYDGSIQPPSFAIEVSWTEVGVGSIDYRSVVRVAGS